MSDTLFQAQQPFFTGSSSLFPPSPRAEYPLGSGWLEDSTPRITALSGIHFAEVRPWRRRVIHSVATELAPVRPTSRPNPWLW